jgi:hypothetical protein
LVENFLWLQNHFLGNRFEPNIFIEHFLSKICYGRKIISSEIGLNQKFSLKIFWSKMFWSKIFYGCKIISSEEGLNQKFSPKLFSQEFFIFAKTFPGK